MVPKQLNNFYQIKIEETVLGKLPEVKNILGILQQTEPHVIIKGGMARLTLLKYLEQQGKIIQPWRLQREEKLRDIDLILPHTNTLPKDRTDLVNSAAIIKEELSAGTQLTVDFEPFKASPSCLERILSTRDLTINEVILYLNNSGGWELSYTSRCWRDIIQGVGMLTSGGKKLIRYDYGRMLPTNYGFFRLFRLWVEGKVEKIYLPEWWISTHFQEAERLEKERFGNYALVIAHQYKNATSQIQKRWGLVLNELGFTDLPYLSTFQQEQELLYDIKNNQPFAFEEERPFGQIIDQMVKEEQQRQSARQKRNEQMRKCQHNTLKTFECSGCKHSCKIQRCECGQIFKPTQNLELPCNWIFKTSSWTNDPQSLMSFPRQK